MLASSIPFLLGLVMLTMGMTLGARDFLPRFCERLKPVLPKLSLASVHFASLALAGGFRVAREMIYCSHD